MENFCIFSPTQRKYFSDCPVYCTRTRSRSFWNFVFRNDLNPANGTYPIAAMGHRPHGATDVKITTSELFQTLRFRAIAGPTRGTDNVLEPFCWSKSDFNDKVNHLDQPDCFNFKPVSDGWPVCVNRYNNMVWMNNSDRSYAAN